MIFISMKDILNTTTKVFLLLESIKESKYKYIAIVNPINREKIMKIKLNLDDQTFSSFLDPFFDNGFVVEQIDKKEFDSLITKDVLNYTL
jgi:hypothetical protein